MTSFSPDRLDFHCGEFQIKGKVSGGITGRAEAVDSDAVVKGFRIKAEMKVVV